MRWLVAANIVWLAAGILAYATRIPMMVGAAFAAAVALPGLLALRDSGAATSRLWIDRSISACIGTWTLLVVLMVLPLMTLEDGGDLWATRGYWVMTLVVANGGFLLMNATAFLAAGAQGGAKEVRTYAVFHLGLLVLALYFLLTVDNARMVFELGSRDMTAFDLRMAPALAAIPGVTWMLGFWRLRASEETRAPVSS